MVELKRDIYSKLVQWKNSDSGKVLVLSGARQVGKTFILNKFAKDNYEKYIYINMVQTSGQAFLQCLQMSNEWKPGEARIEKPLHKAFDLFDPDFQDTKDTIVVVDEIQESARVFSLIRQFSREFQCHFIVTGSYLGKTMNKDYFLPAGDTDAMVLDTLSFEEFLSGAGKHELYEKISLTGDDPHEIYDELRDLYDIYIHIGGYPAVVKTWLETRDLEKCRQELAGIIRIFVEESERYFDGILEVNLFEPLFPSIAQSMIKESKGSANLVTELSKIIFNEESDRVTRKSVNQAIGWLYRSHIIGYCDRANECNIMDITYHSRFYFCDVGVARYFLRMSGADPATIEGIVNENFVYLYLQKLIREQKITGTAPAFGVYKRGEIDFLVRSLNTYEDCAIEVKSGKNAGKTANRLLEDGRVDKVYFLKGDTYGGISGKKLTIPVYLCRRIEF